MAVNRDKPDRWKDDVAASVDMYNRWFLKFAPATFRKTRIKVTAEVEASLKSVDYMRNVTPTAIRNDPTILPTLRMATCPPLAVDRLTGLAGVTGNLVDSIETKQRIPPRAKPADVDAGLASIAAIIMRLADTDLFVWLAEHRDPTAVESARASMIVADRLCGSQANPIIRNEQERRQLAKVRKWLEDPSRGYRLEAPADGDFRAMKPGTFFFRLNVPGKLPQPDRHGHDSVNVPVDAVVMRTSAKPGDLPLLIEAKSAGDFTNTNKRWKEEATKVATLRLANGNEAQFILFLCGYFDSGYLGHEAAEGIDWVWEHRIDDLAEFGL